jgi:hypothetical protein
MASTSSGKIVQREGLRRSPIPGVPSQPTAAALIGRDEDLDAVAGEDFNSSGVDVRIEDLLRAAGEQGDAGTAFAPSGRDARPGLRGRHAARREVEHGLQAARQDGMHSAAQARRAQGEPEA